MFTYKSTEELEAMSAQELDSYKKLEKAHEKAEADKAVKEAVEKATEPLINELKEVKEEIMSVKEKNSGETEKSFEHQLVTQIAAKSEDIKNVFEAKSGVVKW